ncbi:bifunctional hydroxymethylpyrimidine kinase/phosphomethylpyrimidine kinase [Candidatus Providencia siddallii]|uniref:hydroxymethylpyrimidine kinase n=1 Tax=Candidatus Providencia siddallii TaxID=1715285 RepID=A0ABM9NNV5_9GAMM
MKINALTIAGSDPICGSGIQADLKTFSALGVYGVTVITSLVAQNTLGVQSIYDLPCNFVISQLNSIFTDLRIDTIKIGMLSNCDNIFIVSDFLKKYKVSYTVLDTVILAKNGSFLLQNNAINDLCNELLPIVSLITPNLLEASILLDEPIAKTEDQMIDQGKRLLKKGCKAVLIKGGHLSSLESPDWFITNSKEFRFSSQRINTKNTHGTGCTLSSSIASFRPSSNSWYDSILKAKSYLQNTLKYADMLNIGKGIGPLNHFYKKY